jgi:hypothetical protein
MTSAKKIGRVGGSLFLLSAVGAAFYFTYLRSYVIVPGDAATTIANIRSAEFLFRLAIVSNLVSQVSLLFFGLVMFRLFREAHSWLATVFLVSVAITAGLAVMNMAHHFEALIFVSQPDYLKVIAPDQSTALAMTSLRVANSPGQGLLEVFWIPLYLSFGVLAYRFRFIPRILGILLMLMGAGFAINLLNKFLIPQFHPAAFTQIAMTMGALGGLSTMLWLLIMGAKEPVPSRS